MPRSYYLALALLFQFQLWAQPPDSRPQSDAATLSRNRHISEMSAIGKETRDYRLGPGDLIRVSVFGVDEFDHTVRVDSTGAIKLPYLGRFPVAGMTVVELETEVASMLDAEVIKDPEAFVSILEHKAHSVFVLGAVNRPGEYKMVSSPTLIDAIALAGGLDLVSAADEALIQRRRKGPTSGDQTELEVIRVDLNALLEGGSQSLNVAMKDGDVVQIPKRIKRHFFVMGDVNRAGSFVLPGDKEVLVSQALAWAGGPSRTAKLNKGVLVRYNRTGERTHLAIDVKAILAGKKQDFPVSADDIIFIPGDGFKTFTYGMLGLMRNVPAAALMGAIP